GVRRERWRRRALLADRTHPELFGATQRPLRPALQLLGLSSRKGPAARAAGPFLFAAPRHARTLRPWFSSAATAAITAEPPPGRTTDYPGAPPQCACTSFPLSCSQRPPCWHRAPAPRPTDPLA